MDENILLDKLEGTKKLILKSLFDNSNINKWNNNEEIIINNKFENLFCGDWERNSGYKCNLNKFLGKKIKPLEIFETITKELKRKRENSYDLYRANFNPNLFFLFYDKFYNFELSKGYKFYFTPIYDDNKIVAIQIGNRNNFIKNKIMREETIILIELHSRILFSDILCDILSEEIFTKYFIINSIIQKQVKTYIGDKYVDLAYLINKCENKNPGLLNLDMNDYIYIEIQEGHHKYIEDIVRNNAILSSGKSINVHYYINFEYEKSHNKIMKEIIKGLTKIIIKNNPEIEPLALKAYLVFIENLDFNMVDMIVDLKNKKNTIKNVLDMVCKICNYSDNDNFNENKIINKITKDNILLHTKYFEDTSIVFQLMRDNEYLKNNSDKIILTDIGINALLNGISNKYWVNKIDFYIFKTDIENKYFESIINLLKDDQYNLLIKENLLKSSVFYVVKNRDDNKWFKNINFLKKLYTKFHPNIPYMFKEDGNIISRDIIKIFINDVTFKKYDEDNILDDGNLIGYRIVYQKEFDEIMNLPILINNDEDLILSSSDSDSDSDLDDDNKVNIKKNKTREKK